MATFGELLAELRKDHRLTQKDLAKILFVTDGTISNYETGVHYPDVEKLIEISKYFNVTTDYLLGLCKNNLSPDTLNEIFLGKLTIGDIVTQIHVLDDEHKQALKIILNDVHSDIISIKKNTTTVLKPLMVFIKVSIEIPSPWHNL